MYLILFLRYEAFLKAFGQGEVVSSNHQEVIDPACIECKDFKKIIINFLIIIVT